MKNLLLRYLFIDLDAPRVWGYFFQDGATPQMEGIVELHDNIMYYLVLILFSVGWIIYCTIKKFSVTARKTPISNKYTNHGKYVPIQKYYKYSINKFISCAITKQYYTTQSSSSLPSIAPATKIYKDVYLAIAFACAACWLRSQKY